MRLPGFLRFLSRRKPIPGPDAWSDSSRLRVDDEASSRQQPAAMRKPVTVKRSGAGLRGLFNPSLSRAETCLLVRLENGVEVIYRLGQDGRAERIPDYPEHCRLVLSATNDDLRLLSPTATGYSAGKSRLTREAALFEPLAVVTAGQGIYGVKASRCQRFYTEGRRLAPLSALADRLSIRTTGAIPPVSGFVFSAHDDGIALALFFAQVGERLKTFITIEPLDPDLHPDSPDNLHTIFESFMQEAGLPVNTVPVVFSQDDALAGLRGFYAAYPVQGDLLGIPLRTLWQGALAGSLVACGAVGVWWWQAGNELERIRQDAGTARAQAVRDVDAVATRIAADLPGFSRYMGMPASAALAEAESLWQPGGRVESTLTPQVSLHVVFVPVRVAEAAKTDAPDPRSISSALALNRPGCERAALELSGALDEIRIQFRCPGGNVAHNPFRRVAGG